MTTETELIWHNDGHEIGLRIEKSELAITGIKCPHGDDGPCKLTKDGCAVQWFIQRFGLECNVGVCDPAPTIRIAWAFVGDPAMGLDGSQVWFIPATDDFFAAWAATQLTS
jgi:hypothetical protein